MRKKIKSYCSFPTKLARIVQNKAVKSIRPTFWKCEKPDCSGLTARTTKLILAESILKSSTICAKNQSLEDQQKLNQHPNEMKKYIAEGKSHHD